jgi:hypothetical protein
VNTEQYIEKFELGASYPDLDVEEVRRAAVSTARTLRSEGVMDTGGAVVAVFCPNDGTIYHVLVSNPLWENAEPTIYGAGQLLVTLAGPSGFTYPWTPSGTIMHWTYGKKWANSDHSAKVVAMFLTMLGMEVAA